MLYNILGFIIFQTWLIIVLKKEVLNKYKIKLTPDLDLKYYKNKLDSHIDKKSSNYVIGIGVKNNDIFLNDSDRERHSLALGGTGTGKTESVILPNIYRDIKLGRPLVLIDNKGDLPLRDKIYSICESCGRANDFLYFSLTEPDLSNSYSPLPNFDAEMLTDTLLGSFIFTEQYYKDQCYEALYVILLALKATGKLFTWENMLEILKNKDKLEYLKYDLVDMSIDDRIIEKIENILAKFDKLETRVSGLLANLEKLCKLKYTKINNNPKPEINIFDVYKNNKVVLFSLSAQQYEENVRTISKLFLQDIKGLSGWISATIPEKDRKFFPVYVDEFKYSVFDGLAAMLGLGRSSLVPLTLSTQVISDMKTKEFDITEQVLGNTNIKYILRQDGEGASDLAESAGTYSTQKKTSVVETGVTGEVAESKGSFREVEEFKIHPNQIKAFQKGRGAVMIEGQVDLCTFGYLKDLKLKQFKGQQNVINYDREIFKFPSQKKMEKKQTKGKF